LGGAVAGSFIVPFIGSIVLGLAGAFLGAVLFEFLRYRAMKQALHTGFFAFMGKLWAIMVKIVLAMLNLGVFMYLSWR
jgi:uncharacterized protein YqgC (DUF456 family)